MRKMHICNNNKNIAEPVRMLNPSESALHGAIAAIQRFLMEHGLTLSDSFCFGLGSGLSIRYFKPLGRQGLVSLQCCSLDIEKKLLTNLAQPLYSEWLLLRNGKGSYSAPCEVVDVKVTPEMVRNSILDNALSLNRFSRSRGIEALNAWINDLPNWRNHKEWRDLLNSTHRSIVYNSEGGGFRRFYASFLSEASILLPEIEIIGLPRLMRNCASEWDTVAHIIENGSKSNSFPFAKLKTALLTTYMAEKEYIERVLLLAEEDEKVARFYNYNYNSRN